MRPTQATWTSADGTTRRIVDMSDEHLENTIRWLERHGDSSDYKSRRLKRMLLKLPVLRREKERRLEAPYRFTVEDIDYIKYMVLVCMFLEKDESLFGPPPERVEVDQLVRLSPEQIRRAMLAGLRVHVGTNVRETMRPRAVYSPQQYRIG